MKKAMVTDVAFPKKVRLSKKVTINFFFCPGGAGS